MTKDELAHGTVSSLKEICLKISLKYLESYQLPKKENIYLPEDVCKALICKKIETGNCNDDFIATFFADVQKCRMTKANLSCASITDAGIEMISHHCLREVDVSKCETLSERSIQSLVKCKGTLISLNMAGCRHISSFTGLKHFTKLKILDVSRTFLDHRDFAGLSTLVDLKKLIVSSTNISSLEPVRNMTSLTTLDISNCDVESIEPLETVKGTLSWLSLYNCRKLIADEMLETLQKLTQLQHLDLSKDDPDEPMWFHSFLEATVLLVDEQFLEKLLPSLPNLTSLDLSGNARFKFQTLGLFRQHCKQRLQFLGLFLTEMYRYPDIPAEEVSGNANLKQITLSVQLYKKRPRFLISALQELFNIIRERDPYLDIILICSLVLDTMENHPSDKKIQLAGSASLFHLSRDDDDNSQLSAELKRRVIEATLNAMDHHVSEAQIQKNCCLTLCNFRIPNDVSCDYKRIVTLLLRSALVHKEDHIQRIAIGLCNLLVCQVQDSQKIVVGKELQGVEKILTVIRYKMGHDPERGGVLECCWSALWNVTDETPENCALFLANRGLELFMQCKTRLSGQQDLVRNMLGLMGNVAEVRELRPQLMELAHVFYDLLTENPNELEVTYNAGGIISHLASDGPSCWTNTVVSRDQALQRLEETIEKWDLKAPRQMSYRSFAPILRLISGCDTTAIHHWATWALANLCTIDADKYCKLVRDEGGIELLQGLRENTRTSPRVRQLAQLTLDKCRDHPESDLEDAAAM